MALSKHLALTDKICKEATSYRDEHGDPAKDFWLRDLRTGGLALKVTPKGALTWTYDHRDRGTGKSRRITLGRYPAMSVKMAREEVLAIRGGQKVPERERKSRGQGGVTFAQLWEKYLASRKSAMGTSRRLVEKFVIPAIGDRPVAAITSADIDAILYGVTNDGDYNNLLSYLRASRRWGMSVEGRKVLPPELPDYTEGHKRRKVNSGAKPVTDSQYESIFRSLEEHAKKPSTNPMAALAVEFVLYCGLRVKEVADIEVREVTRQYIELHQHKMFYQTRSPKMVHVTPDMEDVVRRATKERSKLGASDVEHPRFFCSSLYEPTTGTRKPTSKSVAPAMRRLWQLVRADANVPDLLLKHSRSGLSSAAMRAGFTAQQIAEVTQHADPRTLEKYYFASVTPDVRARARAMSALISRNAPKNSPERLAELHRLREELDREIDAMCADDDDLAHIIEDHERGDV